MTNEERARDLVDGFFIGNAGDDLSSPNLTKRDLVYSILYNLTQVRNEAFEEARITAYKKIASRPPFGYGNVHLADGVAKVIEALKDGE